MYGKILIYNFFSVKAKGECQTSYILAFMRKETVTSCKRVTKRKIWEVLSTLFSLNHVTQISSRQKRWMNYYQEEIGTKHRSWWKRSWQCNNYSVLRRSGGEMKFWWKKSMLLILIFVISYAIYGASQLAPVVKKPGANAGDERDGVWSLGQEDPLKEGMATHSSTLASWTLRQRTLVGYSPWNDSTYACRLWSCCLVQIHQLSYPICQMLWLVL